MSELPRYALSVRQPWAWAIIHAGKTHENRVRTAITRGAMKPGRIALHASSGMTQDEYESARGFISASSRSPKSSAKASRLGFSGEDAPLFADDAAVDEMVRTRTVDAEAEEAGR